MRGNNSKDQIRYGKGPGSLFETRGKKGMGLKHKISIAMPEKHYRAVEALAEEHGYSRAGIVFVVLEDYLKKNGYLDD